MMAFVAPAQLRRRGRGGASAPLLRAVSVRPRDELLRDRLAELIAGVEIDLVVNARPDARVACLPGHDPDLVGVRGEEVGQHLGPCRRVGGVVRGIAWEIACRL